MTPHVEEAIERYFDGQPPAIAERDALFGHLDRCDTCRARFDELAQLHRALAEVGDPSRAGDARRRDGALPATELALIGASVIGASVIAASAKPAPARGLWAWLGAALVPLTATAAVLVFLAPNDQFTAKGGGKTVASAPALEILCFDETAQMRAHLEKDGTCPAPGYVKLVFASAETIPALAIAALSGDRVVLSARLREPEPRSVIADHATLQPGEVLRVVAVETDEELSIERARALQPIITVTGVAK